MSEAMQAPLGGLFRMAVVSGTPALVLAHLRRGANVNARDASGATPLMLAMARGRTDICQLLLDEGADPRLLDAAGRSIIFYAQPDAAAWISTSGLLSSVVVVGQESDIGPGGLQGDGAAPEAVGWHERHFIEPRAAELDDASFEQGVGGWEAEEVSVAPADDLALRQAAADLQDEIARHKVIDHDPDWADVEIHLPAPAPRRVRNPTRLREQERLRRVFRWALLQGSYAPGEVEALIVGDPAEDEGAARRLRAAFDTLATLGPLREDWDDWRPAGTPGRGKVPTELLDEASEYFELHWSREDIVEASLRRLAKFPPLKAEDDRRAWHRYDFALQSLCAAIVGNPCTSASLASELRAQANRLVWSERSGGESFADDDQDEEGGEEPIRAEVPPGGWSENELAEVSALLDELSRPHNPERSNQREAFLAAVRERRLPGSLLFGLPGLDTDPAIKVALRSFLKARNYLFDANSRLAMWVARRYGWSRLPLEDRYQEASQGLLRAIDRFDPRRGNKFSSYSVWWIRQSVTRAIYDLERVIRIPVHLRETLRRAELQAEALTYELGREPSTDELSVRTGIPPARLAVLLRVRADAVSFDELGQSGDAVDLTQEIASGDPSPDSGVVSSQLEAALRTTLVELAPREERIVRQRFGLNLPTDMTLEEIGVAVEVTRERIRQIEAKALTKMGHPGRSRRLRTFLEVSL